MDTNETTAVGGSEPDRFEASKLEMAAASFVLSLKEKFKLSQAALNFAITVVENISTNNIQHSVMKILQESGSTASTEHCFTSTNPFASLKTEYHKPNFLKKILVTL